MKPLVHALLLLCFLGSTFVYSQWYTYPTYGEYVEYMEKWQEDYPQFAKLYDLGPAGQASLQHRLYAMRISDNVDQNEQEPSFLYIATIHGDEFVGYMSMLHLIDYLLLNYGKDTLVTKLVDSIDIWIAPLCNPDGTYPNGDHTVQYAQRRNVADNFDLVRNFSCPCGNHQYGLYGHFAKETEAITGLVALNNFVLAGDVHGGTEVIIYPWCLFVTSHLADEEWFKYAGGEYADTVWEYCQYNGYLNQGVKPCCDSGMYESHGTFIDYMLYFEHCRTLYLQLSIQKLLDESELERLWGWNYRSLLNYIEQALFGVRGTVTDTLTGEPLNAKVFIENHDTLNSHVYSHLPHGDYYRPIYEGTYEANFSCDGYYPKTITGVETKNNEATILNVKLRKIQTCIIPDINSLKYLSINNWESITKIEIYNLMGKKVKTLPANVENINWKEGNGTYIVRLVGKGINRQFKVMFTK